MHAVLYSVLRFLLLDFSFRPVAEVIVVSDEENTPSPDNSNLVVNLNMNTLSNNAHHQVPNKVNSTHSITEALEPDVHALRELLHKEEKKLSVLKTIHGLQGSSSVVTMASKPASSIQGSALNKTSGSGRNSPNLRAQPKHSIVVVPGNQSSPRQQVATSGSTSGSNTAAGISSRLQQLVDNIAVDQAMTTASERLQPNNVSGVKPANKYVSMTTPPVPGLTSLSATTSPKHTFITSSNDKMFHANNIPKLKPKIITTTTSIHNRSCSSHEIITITDSPVGKKPPPLLSSASRIPTATSNGSIQVPTISSSLVGGMSNAVIAGKKQFLKVAESSRRYQEYVLKQTHAKRNFQKQVERKMMVAPYPKTFRQVWPLIPVHDSSFVRNFGMEAVMHHFDPESKAVQEKTNSKVKPICNQCSCDFASAWQIRKSNSKQLLLCEACDFQNLKILQRSKLSNQLQELLDTVKTEEGKFSNECEETRKQILELEKQATTINPPPPLTSQLIATATAHQMGGTSNRSAHLVANRYQVLPIKQPAQARVSSNGSQKVVIPSVLGQQRSQPPPNTEAGSTKKRPAPAGQTAAPPSKMCKPGSVLDQTLHRLSTQLIKRKLDEQRQECQQEDDVECKAGEEMCPDNARKDALTSPTSPTPAGQRSKSRRKGTPKHKRLLSASSMNSE